MKSILITVLISISTCLIAQQQDSVGNGERDSLKKEEFTIVEIQAKPEGGMAGLYSRMNKELRYPKDARRRGIEGTVRVEFVINRDGSLSDFKVTKGIGGGCDEEAIRVIQSSGKWTPGMQQGKPVRSKFNVPVFFKL